jgi:serine/threonine protein kinase
MIGKTLAHYQITSQIGKGGMGEVYQVKDQKLGRDVAIKVLPEEFAKDLDRVARFQREAKLLASLNHPNITAIHGLEESNGTHYLVMELIEGQTLADRIKAGAIPVEEALKLALQIAEALEAAHEKGVIHRDLKPANIKVTSDDKVKELDFGLAKALAGDQKETVLTDSSTLSMAETQKGAILGTAAYMSPEQARGESVDKRTDIWAFGCVLFELLTGQSVFAASSVSQTLARILERQPDFSILPQDLHPRIKEVLERCLEKKSKNRFHDIADVRLDLQNTIDDPSGVFAQPVPAAKFQKKLRLVIPWVAAFFVLGLIIAGVFVWMLKPIDSKRVILFDYDLPEGQEFNITENPGHTLAVSPDGSQFIYSTSEGLYIHYEDELEARLIPGTDDMPQSPFFSPDGQSVGYWSQADGKLKKIPIRGGAPVDLCDASWVVGANWHEDDTIVYSEILNGVMRVSASGGTPELLIRGVIGFPQLLPDGKSILFTVMMPPYKIAVQSIESGQRKVLFTGNNARYLPTGHIVYNFESNIFAVPFDPETLEAIGREAIIVEGVLPSYAISDAGTLVYLAGIFDTDTLPQQTLVWVDKEGNEEPLDALTPNEYSYPKISPDGTKVALTFNGDIHIWDLAQKFMRKLTFYEGSDWLPIWTPDGERIVFASARDGGGIYWKAADGTGEAELLGSTPDSAPDSAPDRTLIPWSWSKDGKTLITTEFTDISTLIMDDAHTIKTLLHDEERYASNPKISPDGRFMAYTFGKGLDNTDVYVCPFPDVTGGKWNVSTNSNGGVCPLWSPDGKKLFYLSWDNSVMAVEVNTESTFSHGAPKVLFQNKYIGASFTSGTPWDIHPYDNRFLMIKPTVLTADESSTLEQAVIKQHKINIVLNFFEELKEKVPVP